MATFPWACADCHFVPDALERHPRPCPRCGCLAFRSGSLLMTVKPPRGSSSNLQTRSALAGPTESDRKWLRSMRIGW
jgi:hypothetical protein